MPEFAIRKSNPLRSLPDDKENALNQLAGKLYALSPLKVLSRGYSVVTKKGQIVTDNKNINKGDSILIKLHKGEVEAEVTKT